jgi:2,3-bisphosphoglycerate-dependent phosphoglycerate mutase
MTLILNGFDPSFGYEFWRELSFPDVYALEFEGTALNRVRRMWDKAA